MELRHNPLQHDISRHHLEPGQCSSDRTDKTRPSARGRHFMLIDRRHINQASEQDMETTIQDLKPLLKQAQQAQQAMGKAQQAIEQIEQRSKHLLRQALVYKLAMNNTRHYVKTARQHWMSGFNQVIDGFNQARQAWLAQQTMDKTRQTMDKTIENMYGRLERTPQAKEAMEKVIQGMEKAIKSMNRQLKQAQQAREVIETTRQDVDKTIGGLGDWLKQAPQDKEAMEKIIQGMEKTRQHWMDRLKQALEDKHAMETTMQVIDTIIQAMEKTKPYLRRRFNQVWQDKQAIDKTRQDMETIKQELEREVKEIHTLGKNWKKKILVLFTGGTIGSVRLSDGTLVQPSEARKRGVDAKDIQSLLLNAHEEQHPVQYLSTSFETKTLMETLSEDITKGTMEEFTEKLKKIKFENHDGIVLTHGSDTLGDTANYLAMTLSDIKVPMVLVSSHFPVTDARANGVKNLKGAIDFISREKLPGVYVTYHSKGETKVMYGSRVLQCDNITDEFMSISADKKGEKTICPLGVIKEDGNFEVKDQKLFENLNKRRQVERYNLLDSIESLNAQIEVVKPWLGINYNTVNLDNVDAVLHLTYHSGTARTFGNDNENLLAFAKKCKELGKDLYLLMYGKAGRDVYDSTAKYCASGGLTLMNLSEEAARMKLLIGYSLYPDDEEKRKKIIYESVNEEFIAEDTCLERSSPSL